MNGMSEIAGTGYFYKHSPDGAIKFGQMTGDELQELDPQSFAQAFGSQVQSQEARKEATNILDQLNRTRRMNLKLAPVTEDSPVEQGQQQNNSMLGAMMGGM